MTFDALTASHQDEDSDVLPRVHQAATADQLEEMGEALERIKPFSPIRSHPRVPSRPPANRVIVPITARLVRVRDAVARRLGTGQAVSTRTRRGRPAWRLLAVGGAAVVAAASVRRLAVR